MDTITMKREWNQKIIDILCKLIRTGKNAALCAAIPPNSHTYIQDMEYIVMGVHERNPGTILCNKCEMVEEMVRDEAYFIV